MVASRRTYSGLAAALALGALAAGCGDSGSFIDSPFTGAKQTLLGKPAPTPDLPDRPKLVMPPANSALPVPGEAAPARPQWATATQDPNKPASPVTAVAEKPNDQGWFSGIFGSKTQ